MRRLLALIVFSFFFAAIAHAQQDTAFFDAFWRPLPGRDGAAFFRPWPKEEDGKYKLVDYYISGKVQMTGYYEKVKIFKPSDFDNLPLYRNGVFKYYDSVGTIKSESTYSHGNLKGLSKEYYDNGALWSECSYLYDSLNGAFKSYYKDGKLKRDAVYDKGKLVKGQMYDPNGKSIPYTEFRVMPDASYDVRDYMVSNIKYPGKARRNDIEGKIMVKFVVTKKGKITQAEVIQSVHPLLDAEALRAVSEMPDWKPGTLDDEPIDVYYSLPVTFRLED